MPPGPGRNDPCTCGSGRKYKHCCLQQRQQAAVARPPAGAVERNNLGVALKNLGRLEEAAAAYRKALELDPGYAPAHHNLGEIFQRQGALEEARRCFEAALQRDPGLTPSHVNLGNLLTDRGEFPAAVAHYRRALAVSDVPATRSSLGVALKNMGDLEGAVRELGRAVAGAPTLVEARLNLGNALLDCGRASEAVNHLREAIRLRPDFSAAHVLHAVATAAQGDLEEGAACLTKRFSGTVEAQAYQLLGSNLVNLGRFDLARACFEKVLERDPGAVGVGHFLNALRGGNPEHPPEEYVRQVFDAYAENFDQHLVGELGYTVPRELVDTVLATPGPERPWDVLDLGCGTGLVGVEIAAYTRSLAGVDLSEKMLARARARNIYSDLKCADLMTALSGAPPASLDLVTAADVFIYVGALDSLIPAVRRALRSGGLFAFSTEAGDSSVAGYRLTRTGRYVHRIEYLDRLAADTGFSVNLTRPARLRLERGGTVQGWLSVWTAT